MKRANSTGTIEKLSGNRRKPYAVRISDGLDLETGIYKRKYIGFFEKRKDAELFLAQYNKGLLDLRRKPTLGQLYQKHMEEKTIIDPKSAHTIRMYQTSWEHMKENQNIPIDEIKTDLIQKNINKLVQKGIGFSTCNKVKLLYSQLFQLAMTADYVLKNYATDAKIPKKPTTDKRIFSDADITAIKANAYNDPIAGSILVMLYTGLRPGELLSLTKFNIDFNRRILTGGFKTEAGTDRHIPIHDVIFPILKQAYHASDTERIYPWDYSKYNKLYHKTLDALNIDYLSPHKCRKTATTKMYLAGIDKTTLKDIIGHVDFSTTEKYYIGLNDENLLAAISKLE